MSGDSPETRFPRRDFLKAGGALLVGLTFAPRVDAQQPPGGALGGPFTPDPSGETRDEAGCGERSCGLPNP